VKGPNLAPVGYPAELAPMQQQYVSAREPAPQSASANSLWRVGARAFFNDQRASRVGDIVTVMIDIDDSASTKNQTASARAPRTQRPAFRTCWAWNRAWARCCRAASTRPTP
jgi:flagellar L-ring protein precursor FlgH